jgi:DMSO/TMAO reductase YedYZ molybdopterin-dependent catalytic subunit
VTAHDGYRVVFSLPELDPAFSDGRALLADRMDGQPLSAHDGPLRLVLPSEKREARWVRMVERIEMLSAPAAPAR